MMTINGTQIKEVRQDGIVYVDDAGQEQFIDFEACYQNYLERQLSPETIKGYKELNRKTDADVPEHIERVKNIARWAVETMQETRRIPESMDNPILNFIRPHTYESNLRIVINLRKFSIT